MGKNKLYKFAQMEGFSNVYQLGAKDIEVKDYRLLDGRRDAVAGHWAERFGNDHPIVLELGCGRGEYTVGLAARYPEKNFIGVDIKGARMWAGAKEALARELDNAAFLRTNIEMLPYFFAENEVSEIWITFCDPQMKKATKRLTSTFFMERYRMLLKDNGLVHLKTDSPFLYTYTREMLKVSALPVLADASDLYHHAEQVPEDEVENLTTIRTHYEQQWLDRGLTIKYLQWQLPHEGKLVEPEIDIELDTYRSYGRNYGTATSN